jgi:hypothetical protein
LQQNRNDLASTQRIPKKGRTKPAFSRGRVEVENALMKGAMVLRGAEGLFYFLFST